MSIAATAKLDGELIAGCFTFSTKNIDSFKPFDGKDVTFAVEPTGFPRVVQKAKLVVLESTVNLAVQQPFTAMVLRGFTGQDVALSVA